MECALPLQYRHLAHTGCPLPSVPCPNGRTRVAVESRLEERGSTMKSLLRRIGKANSGHTERVLSPWELAENAYNDFSTPQLSIRALKAASFLEPLTSSAGRESGFALLRYADYLGVAARYGLSDGFSAAKVRDLQQRELQACEEASACPEESIRQSALYHLCVAAGRYGDVDRAERAYREAVKVSHLHLTDADLSRMRTAAGLNEASSSALGTHEGLS